MSLKVRLQVPKQQLKAIADELRKIDKKLPGQFRKVLTRTVRPVVNEQKRAARNIPTSGKWGTRGTRKRIASNVKLKVRTSRWPGVRITTQAPWPEENNDAAMLPRGFDTFFSGFDTVWGHQNMTGESWFMKPPADNQRTIERELYKVLNMSAEDIMQAASRNMKTGRPKK